jgi:molybdenum cofactor biosynthesis enzyme MoaA
MDIQSLSVCVPAGCPNNCKFCISKMREDTEVQKDIDYSAISTRLKYARDNGCNVLMFTGTGEPITNINFISAVSSLNGNINKPFRHIEVQTSGVGLIPMLNRLKLMGITTISLSVADIFSRLMNTYVMEICRGDYSVKEICDKIKDKGFTLRISINMISKYAHYSIGEIFDRLNYFNVDQVTFRYLYAYGDSKKAEWVKTHRLSQDKFNKLKKQVKERGTALESLPFGQTRYSFNGISTVLDDDCMNEKAKDTLKFLILKDNKLYTKWYDKGSLLF